LRGRKIAALGMAYKQDVDDLRESPAAEVARLLIDAGADIRAFEPFKTDGIPGIPMAASLEEALKDTDAILLLVRHTQFRDLSPTEVAAMTSARVVIDTVNAWNADTWKKTGFQVFRLGVNK
jgi:UDP-N-acetyl-D-mannosaminuronate dehydrogenase